MFTASAELYDAIYFSFKDYPAEAADLALRIRTLHPGARTVLDVGCGTGEHARLLATQHGYAVDGIDLNTEFLRLARLKHPAGDFHAADMTAFDLSRRYDAVICMFSSIGYVKTLPALEQTLRCLGRHTQPDGVIIVEPWFPPEKMKDGHLSVRTVDAGARRVERRSSVAVVGRISRVQFEYTVTEAGQTDTFEEMHEMGLFTEAETLQTFEAAGLDVRHEAESPGNRGLYIARPRVT